MKDIVLYTSEQEGQKMLFIAKEAHIDNVNSVVTLSLKNGSGYTFDENSLKEASYGEMRVFKTIDSSSYNYKNIMEFWIKNSFNPKKRGKILFFIFVSLIPILGLYIVASFAIINPRYQKNYTYPVLTLTATVLYTVATLLKKDGSFLLLGVYSVLIMLGSLFLFHRKVGRFF